MGGNGAPAAMHESHLGHGNVTIGRGRVHEATLAVLRQAASAIEFWGKDSCPPSLRRGGKPELGVAETSCQGAQHKCPVFAVLLVKVGIIHRLLADPNC